MDDGEREARERLTRLLHDIDRLTPDELARIGYQLAPDAERAPLLDAIEEAARRTGREALVGTARDAVLNAVLRRSADGMYRPTFVTLNWSLSQGRAEDRAAIAEALADAAAAAVVADALDPEVADAFALDAAEITGLSTAEAYEGSLDHPLRGTDDPELRPSQRALWARRIGLSAIVVIAAMSLGAGIGLAILAALAGVVGMVRLARGR